MTSEERREARYIRRRQRREAKRKNLDTDDFEKVFSYGNLYASYKKARRGVAWKSSVQKYITNAPLNVLNTYNRLMTGKYKSPGFFEFDLFERGKHRHIRSTVISERVVQRCLCDNALIPTLCRGFIYDNGACLEHKGYHFTVKRLTKHLCDHYHKYGNDGYILLFDFSKFFDNVSHELTKATLRKNFTDERIIKLTEHFIDAFGDKGMGLGSQISQVFALSSANRLDHYVKEVLRIKGYGRYMDDGYLIHPSKEYLKHCLEKIKEICDELGVTLNQKKTQIVKLSHGFKWLKMRVYLTETGKIIKKMDKRSITRERKKLKKLYARYVIGKLTITEIYPSWQSWKSYAEHFNAYHTICNMAKLWDRLFIRRRQDAVF